MKAFIAFLVIVLVLVAIYFAREEKEVVSDPFVESNILVPSNYVPDEDCPSGECKG